MNLVINTDLIKQYLNNNEVDAIVYNGIELESLIINGEELWTSSLFKYELLSNGTYSIVGCSSNISGNIVIPGVYNNVVVTQIGDEAFSNRTAITSITIPKSIIYIGPYAFYGCTTNMTFEHPYWYATDRADPGWVGYYTINGNTYSSGSDYDWYKFYAPEVAATINSDENGVDVTVYNPNNESLTVTIDIDYEGDVYTYSLNVPANGTNKAGYYFPTGFDAFSVVAYFNNLTNAKSNRITIEYSYWPQEDTTT